MLPDGIDDFTCDHIRALLDASVPESTRLDYKRTEVADNDKWLRLRH